MNLGRYFITLTTVEKTVLSYNYNYELLKFIYKAIDHVDSNKATSLHDVGFKGDNNKLYKLINPCLIFEDSTFGRDGISLDQGEQFELMLGGDEEYINLFIKGIVQKKEIRLFNSRFKVHGVRKDNSPKYRRQILYKVLTEVIESKWDNGIRYLNIYESDFYNALAKNLKNKYKIIYEEEYKDDLYFDIENILGAKKKKIQGIKDKYYKVGYGKFNIWIEASIKMQKVVYYCGLGQDNTLGAGTLMYITSNS